MPASSPIRTLIILFFIGLIWTSCEKEEPQPGPPPEIILINRVDTIIQIHYDTVEVTKYDTVHTVLYDTLLDVRYDTIYTINTDTVYVERIKTVTKTDTVVRIDTVFETEIVYEVKRDTVVDIDTVTVVERDTVFLTDTVYVEVIKKPYHYVNPVFQNLYDLFIEEAANRNLPLVNVDIILDTIPDIFLEGYRYRWDLSWYEAQRARWVIHIASPRRVVVGIDNCLVVPVFRQLAHCLLNKEYSYPLWDIYAPKDVDPRVMANQFYACIPEEISYQEVVEQVFYSYNIIDEGD